MESENVAVIGAGSWGTALAISLAKGGHHVSLWARREDAARLMSEERHNPTYLPDAIIPDSVHVTHDLAEAIHGATIWLIATPSQTVRQVAKDLDSYLTPDVVVVSVAKGIENGTLLTTSCVLHDAFSDLPRDRIVVLYGPSHAEEVASECPTTVVAASTNRETAKRVQRTFMTCHLRVYVNHDTRGVEIAGSVKNVLAIAAGISDGVGFGDNAKAAILTRGLAEIKRLGVAMGADPSTFAGLAGASLPTNKIDGQDIWPLMSGRSKVSPHEVFYYFQVGGRLQSMRKGKWKIRLPETAGQGVTENTTPAELYDLSIDVGEQHNVGSEHQNLVANLVKEAQTFEESLKSEARPEGQL